MQIHCPKCGQSVPAEDVNLDRMLAKCPACNEVFSFGGDGASERLPTAPRRAEKNVPRPADITVVDTRRNEVVAPAAYRAPAETGDPDALVLRRRWFAWPSVFLIVFAVGWDSFLIFWYGAVLTQDGAPWIAIVFPLVHVAVGVGVTYAAVAQVLNVTEIRADRQTVRVTQGPIPYRGNFTLPTERLRQLFVRPANGSKSPSSWEIMADTTDDTVVKVLGSLPTRDHALFIEHAVEQHLGVEDDPSRDEL